MSEELKPCPFCGAEVEIIKVGRDWYRLKAAICHEDSCLFGEDWEIDVSQSELSKYWLMEEWNTRTESTELEQLRKENRFLRGCSDSPDQILYYEWKIEQLRSQLDEALYWLSLYDEEWHWSETPRGPYYEAKKFLSTIKNNKEI